MMPMARIVRAGVGLLVILSGCVSPAGGPGVPRPSVARDPYRAGRLNAEGLSLAGQGCFAEAESVFRDAIGADAFCGQAHCNLGLVLLEQKRFYEAATQLEFACRLMPKASQPRHNLGVLYEKVGRFELAEEELRQALRLAPDDIEIIGHLARVNIRTGSQSGEVREWLQILALRDDDAAWNGWARRQLSTLQHKPAQGDP